MLQVVSSSRSGSPPSGQVEPVANQSALELSHSNQHSPTIIVDAEESLRGEGSSNQPVAEDSASPVKKKARTSKKAQRKKTIKPSGK